MTAVTGIMAAGAAVGEGSGYTAKIFIHGVQAAASDPVEPTTMIF